MHLVKDTRERLTMTPRRRAKVFLASGFCSRGRSSTIKTLLPPASILAATALLNGLQLRRQRPILFTQQQEDLLDIC